MNILKDMNIGKGLLLTRVNFQPQFKKLSLQIEHEQESSFLYAGV